MKLILPRVFFPETKIIDILKNDNKKKCTQFFNINVQINLVSMK